MASNNPFSRCGRHAFHCPATSIFFLMRLLLPILLTFAVTLIAVMVLASLLAHVL